MEVRTANMEILSMGTTEAHTADTEIHCMVMTAVLIALSEIPHTETTEDLSARMAIPPMVQTVLHVPGMETKSTANSSFV
jgi:hypothetical protein